MAFSNMIQEAMETRTLTDAVEAQIKEMLWTESATNVEMALLEQFLEALANGTITHA